jgi:hypothetical protein
MKLARRAGWSMVAAMAAAGAVGVSGCKTQSDGAPPGSAIVLAASTVVMPVNGDAEITALVLEEGSFSGGTTTTPTTPNAPTTPSTSAIPVNDGTLVAFTTTLGRLEPSEARTVKGKAIVRLLGDGRSGTATIMAISGSATKTLDLKVGVAGAGKITVVANPQALPPGVITTMITARVEDAQGNGLLGIPVHFSSTSGSIETSPVITDHFGIAQTRFTTTTNAQVVAAIGSQANQSATINITVGNGSSGG